MTIAAKRRTSVDSVPQPVADLAVAVGIAAVAVAVLSALSPTIRRWWWLVAGCAVVAAIIELGRATIGSADHATVPAAPERRPVGSRPVPVAPGAPQVMAFDGGSAPHRASTAPVRSGGRSDMLPMGPPPRVSGVVWRSDVFWVPKTSHSADEHEDAWAIDDRAGRAALSDGASSAFMAREWASSLTRAYVDGPPHAGVGAFRTWLTNAAHVWSSEAVAPGGDWWVDASQSRGSFATLVGVHLDPVSMTWTTLAVGDSCLVHLGGTDEGRRRLLSFPLEQAVGFDRHPDLLSSNVAPGEVLPVVRSAGGDCRAGDQFLLLSDALAHWALVSEQQDRDVWSLLAGTDADEFGALVRRERAEKRLEDDDTTMVRLAVT